MELEKMRVGLDKYHCAQWCIMRNVSLRVGLRQSVEDCRLIGLWHDQVHKGGG